MPAPGDQHKAINNPFQDEPTRINEYTAQEIATLQSRLDRQLGPEYISTRPGAGGSKVHYLAAEKVINLANEVFGFNGWSSGIQNVQIDFVDESPTTGKISLGLSIIVRVTLKDGTYHEDIGYGTIENCKGKAAAFEKAKKEAATDALKRALRNFGNVLGNCLYDKDYLQRVTKLKPDPSRWDAGKLHRHPDFAPVRKDPSIQVPTEPIELSRTVSVQSKATNSTDFEDDFGGNLFDGVEFDSARPDEVVLDTASVTSGDISDPRHSDNGQKTSQQSQQRQQMPRVQSMPTLRPPGAAPGPPNIQPQRPPGQHQPQPQTPGVHPNLNAEAARNRSLAAQAEANQGHRIQHAANALTGNGTSNGQQPPQMPQQPNQQNSKQGETVGFVTGRAAELMQQMGGEHAPLPPNAPTFNPHQESPSLRRTNGVDHNKSVPINRSTLASVPQGATSNPQPQQPQPPPIRSNFVNPQTDANRRIGMPNAAHSPLANRGGYRPPGPAIQKRPPEGAPRAPLADVSNVKLEANGGEHSDAKRQKIAG